MPEPEKLALHAKLYKSVTTHTSHTWAAMLVRMLLAQIGTEHTAHSTPFLEKDKLIQAYKKAKQRLFLFDYDVCFVLTHTEEEFIAPYIY